MNGAKTSYMSLWPRFKNMSAIWKKPSNNLTTSVHTPTVKRLREACALIATTTKVSEPRMPPSVGILVSSITLTDFAKSAIWSHITLTTRSTSKRSVGKDGKSWDCSARDRILRSYRSKKIPSKSRSHLVIWRQLSWRNKSSDTKKMTQERVMEHIINSLLK